MRAIVIAVDGAADCFAVETEAGFCAVLWVDGGSAVQAGDILRGDVSCRAPQRLDHGDGWVSVTRGSGPISRLEALARVAHGRRVDEAARGCTDLPIDGE